MNPNKLLSEIKESGKTILVVGLGISGLESLKFLARNGIKAIGVDRASPEQFEKSNKFPREFAEVKESGIQIKFGVDDLSELSDKEEIALAILSPGIPLQSPVVTGLKNRKLPLISEFELGVELLQRPTIVVTGSNGKSTTVSLIHHILQGSGIDSFLCGNVGNPVIAGVANLALADRAAKSHGWIVAEASSYQLESCQVLKPQIAVFLNITENHLERHGTFENYLAAKTNLFLRMDDKGVAVYPAADHLISDKLSQLPIVKLPLVLQEAASVNSTIGNKSSSQESISDWSAELKSNSIKYDQLVVSNGLDKFTFDLTDLNLIGSHNRLNAAFAVTTALRAGADADKVKEALSTFTALEHRLKRVEAAKKEVWINDSKSTTVAATVAALDSILADFSGRKVTLLVGGQVKIGSWLSLVERINLNPHNINKLIVFGGDREKIRASLREVDCEVVLAEGVKEAISLAKSTARDGEVVLFSPGALSFDEFRSFGERGEAFEKWVQEAYS